MYEPNEDEGPILPLDDEEYPDNTYGITTDPDEIEYTF